MGGLRVRQGRRTIARFRTQKTGALLAYLAFYRHRAHAREILIEMLWPEAPTGPAGRKSLSVALASLRSMLEPPGTPAQSILLADSRTIGFSPAVITDVSAFEEHLQRAERAGNEQERAARLSNAVDLYAAPLLPGFYEGWIVPEQERLIDQYRAALGRLARFHETQGNVPEAIRYVRQAVQADPLSEATQHELIRLLRLAGYASGAVRQYEEMARLLETELGEDPAAVTRALVEPLLAAVGGLPLAVPPHRERRPLTTRPNFGTASTLRPAEERPLLPPATTPGPLPGQPQPLTRFFGQEDELLRLGWLLKTPSVRLITLTGPGGMGKTRLALAVAGETQHRNGRQERNQKDLLDWGDQSSLLDELRVFFVALAHVSEARLLPVALADAVGLDPKVRGYSPSADPLAALAEFLNERPTLLVLDNFEHLVGEGTPLVEALLTRVPTLTCLVTSRQRLPVEGEHEFPIRPLPFPPVPRAYAAEATREQTVTPETLREAWAAVALFVDRAQLARPDFQLTRRNAGAVAELVGRLEGIPLAIELAAARAQVLTPHQMLAQLSRRFEFLVRRQRRVAPDRHRSLRETIAWSLRLLPPELQRFFSYLSVFRSGWTAEAAEALTGDPLALDHLAQLCDASLVQSHDIGDEIRFTMLETLREFAAEQLDEAERTALRHRHGAYFIALAERAEPYLQTAGQNERLDQLDRDNDNLRATLDALEVTPGTDAAQAGLTLASTLSRFWLARGHVEEGRRRVGVAFARYAAVFLEDRADGEEGEEKPGGDTALVARGQNAAGILAMTQRDFAEARKWYHKSLLLSRTLGDTHGVAATLNNLAVVESEEGNFDQARRHYEESLALWKTLGERRNVAAVLTNCGGIAAYQQDLATARRLFEEGLTVARELGDIRSQARILRNLGKVLYEQGEHEAAAHMFQDSIRQQDAQKDALSLAFAVLNLGFVTAAQGLPERANRLIGAALATFARLNTPLPTFERDELARHTAALSCGGNQSLVAARAEGEAMTEAATVAYALAPEGSPSAG